MIDSSSKLVGVVFQNLGAGKQVPPHIGPGVEVKDVLRHWIDLLCWDAVSGHDLAKQVVDERRNLPAGIHRSRKVSLTFQVAGNSRCPGVPLAIAEAFVISKEECLVLLQGPAHRGSELVLLQGFNILREKVSSIEDIVAEKLIDTAMNRVASRLHDQVGIGAETFAKLSRCPTGDDPKLSNGVDGRLESKARVDVIDVTRSVNEKVVGLRPHTVD